MPAADNPEANLIRAACHIVDRARNGDTSSCWLFEAQLIVERYRQQLKAAYAMRQVDLQGNLGYGLTRKLLLQFPWLKQGSGFEHQKGHYGICDQVLLRTDK